MDKLKVFIKLLLVYVVNRLKEASTWAGIFALASAYGFHFTPEQVQAITAFGLILVTSPDLKLPK
jgi:hypothetical protein